MSSSTPPGTAHAGGTVAGGAPRIDPSSSPADSPDTADAIDADAARLLLAAQAAQRQAHAPYSRFAVGAAVLDEHGNVHAGCNVENAAYPQGVCAEAGALSAMVLGGGRRLRAVVVVGDGTGLVTPCGGCRQKLREFGAPDLPVWIGDRARLRARFTLAQLLPESFGPDHLGAAGGESVG